jgi:hypothetical protein
MAAETGFWILLASSSIRARGEPSTVTVAWDHPATNAVRNTGSSLQEFRLYRRTTTNEVYEFGIPGAFVPAAAWVRQASLRLDPGDHLLVVTALGTNGVESAPSAELAVHVPEAQPAPAMHGALLIVR